MLVLVNMIPILLAVCLLVTSATAVPQIVDLSYRQYRGQELQNGLTQWLGIQYAAPPIGDLRFRPPQDPPVVQGVQDAYHYGPVCLRTGQDPYYKETSEDCLYLDVMAPSNATETSKLPVMVWIQGGAFNANTRPHFNSSGLIAAAQYDMVVVNFNYRVGLWGFLTNGDSITANNGLRDQRKVLEWVQQHIHKFGGNKDHVVLVGSSAGAASVSIHMTADNGTDRGLFHGATLASASYATILTIDESQYQYNNLAIRLGCTVKDSLACLRNKTAVQIQKVNTYNLPLPRAAKPPLYQWLPVLDNEFIPDYPYRAFAEGRVIKVPTIIGDDKNGGTDFTERTTASLVDSNLWIANQYPTITPDMFGEVNRLYPNTNNTCPNAGCYWRQLSDVYGDIRFMCPALFMSSQLRALGSSASYSYLWNVEDPALMREGLGVPHTVETDALLGTQYGKEGAPESYKPGGINEMASPIMQGYWTSFIRSLDPNKHRYPGTAEWRNWETGSPRRIVFGTKGKTEMEEIPPELKEKCEFWVKYGTQMLL
uniref:Carboxylic ester hydrolase n=1 Tax=Bionectria ochroleuca TaxID=29856 RepID=A0A8H7TVS9_BIOOC